MVKKVVFAAFVLGLGLSSCQSVDQKKATRQKDAQEDIEKVNEANAFLKIVGVNVFKVVEISRIAQQKASLTKVKEFAKNMITDYDDNIAELKELAGRKQIKINLSKSEDLEKAMTALSGLKGIDFDKAYINWVLMNHQEEITQYRQQAENGKDIETKAFAAGKLPILVHNLDMARTLHDSMETGK